MCVITITVRGSGIQEIEIMEQDASDEDADIKEILREAVKEN